MEKKKITEKETTIEEGCHGNCCAKICDPNTAVHRYIILFTICLCGIGDYFCLDNPAALESNILSDLHITETEYMGFYSWSYWPGAAMCLLSGFLIDRILGVRLGIGLFSWLVSVGQSYWPGTAMCLLRGFLIDRILGVRLGTGLFSWLVSVGQVLFATGAFVNNYWVMCVGRIMFSLAGAPFSLSTQKLTAKWFQGRELTMAFGLRVSVARVGSVVNMNVMQPIYKWFSNYFHGYQCLGMALYVGVIICVISFLSGLVICFLDKRAEAKLKSSTERQKSVPMRLSDIKEFPLTFWLTVAVTSIYYLALFPFISLGPVFFEMKYDKDPQIAGNINSLPYMVSLAMPLFGLLIDKTGRNLIWLFIGIILSLTAHALFAFTFLNPYISVVLLGIGYTIMTAVVWPLVAYVVKADHLGTAYGIMNALISVVQGGIAYLTGYLADSSGYLILQVFFMACVCAALFVWVLLYISDNVRGGILMFRASDLAEHIHKKAAGQSSSADENEASLETKSPS